MADRTLFKCIFDTRETAADRTLFYRIFDLLLYNICTYKFTDRLMHIFLAEFLVSNCMLTSYGTSACGLLQENVFLATFVSPHTSDMRTATIWCPYR